jgi:hypothetical protein
VHLGSCNLRAVWHTLETWMRRAFDQITLADLLQGEGHITELLRKRLAESAHEPADFVPLTLLTKTSALQTAGAEAKKH